MTISKRANGGQLSNSREVRVGKKRQKNVLFYFSGNLFNKYCKHNPGNTFRQERSGAADAGLGKSQNVQFSCFYVSQTIPTSHGYANWHAQGYPWFPRSTTNADNDYE